jgi:hypothetical protein
MSHFDKLSENNSGGGRYIYFADILDIDLFNFPEEIEKTVQGTILFVNPLNGFQRLFGTNHTLQFSEEKLNNGMFLTEITGNIPKDRRDIIAEFEKIEKRRHVIIFADRNDNLILVGNDKENAKFQIKERKSKQNPLERNEYLFEISCLRRFRSPFYTAPITEGPAKKVFAPDIFGGLIKKSFVITTEEDTPYLITHDLDTEDIIVEAWEDQKKVDVSVDIINENQITVLTNSAITVTIVII